MSHSSITYHSSHGGIYHSSHALEGGSAAGDGRIKAWYPDKFNRKIVVVTFENVELWDMDGGGYDSEILSNTIETQDGFGVSDTSANYDHTSFFNNGICYNYSGTIAYNGQTDTYWDAPAAILDNGLEPLLSPIKPRIVLWDGYPYGYRVRTINDGENDDPPATKYRKLQGVYIVNESGSKTLIANREQRAFTNPPSPGFGFLEILRRTLVRNDYFHRRGPIVNGAKFHRASRFSGRNGDNANAYEYILDGSYNEVYRGIESDTVFGTTFPLNAIPVFGVGINISRPVLGTVILNGNNTYRRTTDTTYPVTQFPAVWVFGGYGEVADSGYKLPQADTDHILLTDNSKWYYSVIRSNGSVSDITEIRSSIPTRSSAIIGTYWFGEGYLYFDHKDSGTGDDLISRIDLSNGIEEELIRLVP